MFISVTSPLVLCMYKFDLDIFIYCYKSFLPGSDQLPVGLCFRLVCAPSWKITTVYPVVLTMMFKNILRTFEAEILEIFKNIQL